MIILIEKLFLTLEINQLYGNCMVSEHIYLIVQTFPFFVPLYYSKYFVRKKPIFVISLSRKTYFFINNLQMYTVFGKKVPSLIELCICVYILGN